MYTCTPLPANVALPAALRLPCATLNGLGVAIRLPIHPRAVCECRKEGRYCQGGWGSQCGRVPLFTLHSAGSKAPRWCAAAASTATRHTASSLAALHSAHNRRTHSRPRGQKGGERCRGRLPATHELPVSVLQRLCPPAAADAAQADGCPAIAPQVTAGTARTPLQANAGRGVHPPPPRPRPLPSPASHLALSSGCQAPSSASSAGSMCAKQCCTSMRTPSPGRAGHGPGRRSSRAHPSPSPHLGRGSASPSPPCPSSPRIRGPSSPP